MGQLTISLLGPFQVLREGLPVTGFESNKVRALLAYLAAETDRPHSRQALAGLLWSDYPEASALASLRHALAILRHILGERQVLGERQSTPPFLTITRETIQLNPASNIDVDVRLFEDHLSQSQISNPQSSISNQQSSIPTPQSQINNLKSAIALYRAPFLEGFSCDSPAFEEWAMARRERIDRQLREALERLAGLLGEGGEHEQSIQYARRLLELEPWDEAAHRLVMQGLAQSGQRSAALVQYETCRRVLKQELDVEPAVETKAMYEAIRSGGLGPIAGGELAHWETETAPRHNLPLPLTSFVGREMDLAEVRRLLGFPAPGLAAPKNKVRLLTLTGAGGCGKTRLAIEAARSLAETGIFKDGARWVDLTALSDPALVPQTVAAALGLPGAAGSRGLKNFLHEKTLLLVLDNTEHLIEACARLAEDLLTECPGLVILATSREPLGIPGEVLWRVPSLATPEPQSAGQLSADELLEYGAVRLFAERAEAISPGWRLNGSEGVVAVICRRLDGIPLAIELAAARVRMLSVEQIAARLEDAFGLLTGGSRTALPRHQTLRSCIDWSYRLLSEPERILLQRLSVFAGGWTLEAAEAVAAGKEQGDLLPAQLLNLLGLLVDKSLVIVEQTDDKFVRYRLLETIRQYAREKLAAAGGEEAAVRDRHLAYYLALAERIEPEFRSREKFARLNQTAKELDNLRLALGYALETNLEAELRLASALMWFILPYMHREEGLAWLEKGLTHPEAQGIYAGVRAKALSAIGRTADFQQKMVLAKAKLEESLQLCRELGEAGKKGLATALTYLGTLESRIGDFHLAETYLREALALYQEVSDPINLYSCLDFLSALLWVKEHDSQEARRFSEECLALKLEVDDQDGIGWTTYWLGVMALEELDLTRAKPFFEQSANINRRIRSMDYLVGPIVGLGDIALLEGDIPLALSYFKEAADIQHVEGSLYVLYAFMPLGDLYLVSGKNELARQCFNEAKTFAEKSGSSYYFGWAQYWLARLAWLEGDHAKAQQTAAEALAQVRTGQNLIEIPSNLIRWGSLLCHGGDPAEAAEYLLEGIRSFGQTRNWVGMAVGVDGLARLAAGSQPERAARLFGAAAHMHPYLPNLLYPLERAGREAALAQVKAALGAEAFARAWEEGQDMTPAEVYTAVITPQVT